MELRYLAKYPFLGEAREYVRSLDMGLGELLEHPVYSASFGLGEQRLRNALQGAVSLELDDDLSMELALLSYPVARALAHLTGNRAVVDRYGEVEAEHAFLELRGETPDVVAAVREDLKLPVGDHRITVVDFLRLAERLARRSPRWKLVNRVVDGGFVLVSGPEEMVLLRESIRLRISEPVDPKGAPPELRRAAKRLAVSLERPRVRGRAGPVEEGRLPPCIRHMLSLLESGEAGHNGMFILGTFFLGLGLSEDEVVGVFRRSPRFDEEKARYQLRFLSGERGGTEYSCPGCVKIKGYGLCAADCPVKHPLEYVRKGLRL